MKQYIKSYHLFLSQHLLRWVMYLVYPIVFVGSFWWLSNKITTAPAPGADLKRLFSLLIWALGNLIVSLEIFVDSAIFGGIASKDTNKLEYLKTSVKGIPCLKKALLFDIIRRLGSLTLIVGICCHLSQPYYSWADAISITLTFFTLIQLGLLVTRRFSTILVAFITASAIYVFLPAVTVLVRLAPVLPKILLPVLTGFTAAALGRWLILSKARNSYYDTRNEKSVLAD